MPIEAVLIRTGWGLFLLSMAVMFYFKLRDRGSDEVPRQEQPHTTVYKVVWSLWVVAGVLLTAGALMSDGPLNLRISRYGRDDTDAVPVLVTILMALYGIWKLRKSLRS